MYFAKDFLLVLYRKLSSLYSGNDIEAQGGTQFVSELKYFLATDEFKKKTSRPCDSQVKEDKDLFIKCVGSVVFLSKTDSGLLFCTKNFSNSVGESKDYDVGSNFFSVNTVRTSLHSDLPLRFPARHAELLSIEKGKIDVSRIGYENIAKDKDYLGNSIYKFALLFLWLNRYSNFIGEESVYSECLRNLEEKYSSALINAFNWKTVEIQTEIKKILENASYTEQENFITNKDFTISDKNNKTQISYLSVPLANLDIPKEKIVDELAKILLNDKNTKGTYAVQYFGLRYAKLIKDNCLPIKAIVEKSGISESYYYEIQKGIGIYNLALQDNSKISDMPLHQSNTPEISSSSTYIQSHDQRIFYGVPGCGKSNKIRLILDKAAMRGEITDKDEQIVRVVFHPEYTNSDFIGQIMPKRNKESHIEYSFEAGAFTKILRRAYLNPYKPYYLIVEEVNRGNATAIFGDVFQLLDRFDKDESEETNGNRYGEGWSSYSINNSDINWYVRNCSDKTETDESNTAVEVILNTTEKPYSEIKVGGITINANTGLRLPPNLSILGTMNTSDQNVFTLDNAFQRRWNPELIENDFPREGSEEWSDKVPLQQNADIAETGVKWDSFRTAINKVIAKESVNTGLSSMEDKRLGCWFVKNEDGKISAELFANKVLKYLWDDAFKFSRSKIFGSYTTFEEVRKDFIGSKKFGVFNIKLEGIELDANQNEESAQQDGE